MTDTPGILLDIAYAAHRTGDTSLRRYAAKTLLGKYGIRLAFARGEQDTRDAEADREAPAHA